MMIRILPKTLAMLMFGLLIYGCSSENTPIAEVFLGDWTVYEKIKDNEAGSSVTGEMKIEFGTDLINFVLTTDEETPLRQAGIVLNHYLYMDIAATEYFGQLSLDDDILRITLQDGTVYNAR